MAKKILIVEDEPSLLKALNIKLKASGFEIVSAKNGRDGLDLALKEKPDLILLDILMPILDGLTMLKLLRKDEWGKKTPVIILTNMNDKDKISDALQAQVQEYLVKSDWKLEDIVTKVRARLSM